jgi:hypothetical protein
MSLTDAQLRAASIVRPLPAAQPMLLHLIVQGQSLGVGSWGIPIPAVFFHPEPTRRVLMLETLPWTTPASVLVQSDVRLGRNRLSGSAPADQQTVVGDTVLSLTPAVGRQFTTSSHGLTPIESMARQLLPAAAARWPGGVRLLVSALGVGGAGIRSLRKVPTVSLGNGVAPYADCITAVTQAKAIAERHGWRYRQAAVLWKQGEADGNLVSYGTELAGLIAEWNADVQAITGQASPPVWVSDQYSTFENGETNSVLALLAAHDAGLLTLAGPNYWLAPTGYHTDYQHLSPRGYALAGEMLARVLSPPLFGGSAVGPLRPLAATRSGAQITVTFDMPTPPLVLDAVSVNDPGNFGFEVTVGGSPATISTVEVVGGTSVRITLASAPTGAVRVRYAMRGYITPFSGGYTASEQPRGCLRDSATAVATYDGTTLRNWCVHFDLDAA